MNNNYLNAVRPPYHGHQSVRANDNCPHYRSVKYNEYYRGLVGKDFYHKDQQKHQYLTRESHEIYFI